MTTCLDCYNEFMCRLNSPTKFKKHWDNETICNNFESDQIDNYEMEN